MTKAVGALKTNFVLDSGKMRKLMLIYYGVKIDSPGLLIKLLVERKVARRHFSTTTWGRPTSNSLRTKAVGALKTNSVLGSRLHVCNYEHGIVFIVPPSDANSSPNHKSMSLDDIILTFVVPAPKYRPNDTPATKQAIRETLVECEKEISMEAVASG
ncbi:unnamed protein product [Camellia sinensis]